MKWGEDVTRMVLELLSHHTPPSCIGPTILTVAKTICPNSKVVIDLPGVSFVRHCRSVLAYLTKMLAAYQLALVDKYLEHHSDGFHRRQTAMNNSVVRIAVEGGYRNITLNTAILLEDESSAVLTQATMIVRTFREGQVILKLKTWHEVTAREYPHRHTLIAKHPSPSELSLAKLAQGRWLMTDT